MLTYLSVSHNGLFQPLDDDWPLWWRNLRVLDLSSNGFSGQLSQSERLAENRNAINR